jgi:hypothetical protein
MYSLNPLKAAFVIFLLSASLACAQESREGADGASVQRLCLPEDLEGHTFALVLFRETPPARESKAMAHFRYNYLAFLKNGHFNMHASNKAMKTAAMLELYFRQDPTAFQFYTLSPTGVLNLAVNDKIIYSYRCVAIIQNKDEFVKGDLVLTGYTRKKKTVLYKLYRRWY